MELPKSCDTFVVLPPLTKHGVVFGKNSDRPQGEIQEVVYIPPTESTEPVKCTYIEIESAGATKAVILSKPNWMWGAEMGANECGVAIGNEAVWTNDNDGDHDPHVKRLLGMDLVRLGLERSSNANEALEVITQLLEKYGQGGPCSKNDSGFAYHNSFLIADSTSAWVLETSGKHWAAVQVTSGYRNISNVLTITTKIDKKSDGLEDYAKSKGLWDGQGEFNFCEAFSGEKKPGDARYTAGEQLLSKFTASNNFKETDMFTILRDTQSGICRSCEAPFPTQGSQVSVLSVSRPSIHWFTSTPDPSKSVFKPFIFTKNATVSKHTQCSSSEEPHTLYSLHSEAIKKGNQVQELLRNMEAECVQELETVIENIGEDLSEFDDLLKDCVETEESTENIKFLLTNEYMRMWFKEKAVYDKNTYIRDQIIRDECKIKRRTIQRMATFRKQSKNQFIEDFLERKIGRNKPTRKDQELRQENLKYKPACPKLAENKKETKIHKAKPSSKPVRSTTSKANKDNAESEESYEGCEIVVCPLNCVQSG